METNVIWIIVAVVVIALVLSRNSKSSKKVQGKIGSGITSIKNQLK